MGEIGCLIEHLGHSKISDFDLVILAQEHINGLDVPMQNFMRVKIVHSNRHLNEELPNLGLTKLSTHLSFQMLSKVSIFAVFHHNVDCVFADEAIIIFAHVFTVDLREDGCFKRGLSLLMCAH